MTVTISELMRQTLRTADAGAFATIAGAVTIVLLIVLLAQKEFIRSIGKPRTTIWTQTLNIAIFPLFIAFLVVVALRFVRLGL